MPTYEYECKSCGHGFEVFQTMTDQPVKECPQCGKEVRRLIFGGTGVIFKGAGFYVTDRSAKTEKKDTKPSAGKTASSGNTDGQSPCSAACPAAKQCPAASASAEVKTA